MKDELNYQGNELELFGHATHWKTYVAEKISRFVGGNVLEVGAGPGNFTSYLINDHVQSWTFVEPDPGFANVLKKSCSVYTFPVDIVQGTINDLPLGRFFDTIIYLDVLEHIAHDREEVQQMMNHLNPGGFIIILCPAFNFLYSPFDKAIGHHRRYTRRTLFELFPASVKKIWWGYLDSTGFFASAINRLLLKQSYPSLRQIKFWDRIMVPFSRFTDKGLGRFFGKSIIVVVQKPLSK